MDAVADYVACDDKVEGRNMQDGGVSGVGVPDFVGAQQMQFDRQDLCWMGATARPSPAALIKLAAFAALRGSSKRC